MTDRPWDPEGDLEGVTFEQAPFEPPPPADLAPPATRLDPGWEALRTTAWEADQAGPAWPEPDPQGTYPAGTDPQGTDPRATAWPEPQAGTPAWPEPQAAPWSEPPRTPAEEPTAFIEPARSYAPEAPTSAVDIPAVDTPSIPTAATDMANLDTASIETLPRSPAPSLDDAGASRTTGAVAQAKVPRPAAAHRRSPARYPPGIRPAQVPYKVGLGRRLRAIVALLVLALVLAGVLAAVAIGIVAGIAAAISHAASS